MRSPLEVMDPRWTLSRWLVPTTSFGLGCNDRPTESNASNGEVALVTFLYLVRVGMGQAKKRIPSLSLPVGSWAQHRYWFATQVLPTLKNDVVGCPGGCGEGEYCIRQLCSDAHELPYCREKT